ncbi:MAG: transglycosylase domain-containing protein [Woeseiaceae bacterium]|nr:transglycosylase domain-containing protein [Woeseiaceae bacterium]
MPLADIAPGVQEATLIYEDRHYRRHPGINPAALVRAAWSTWVTV